MAGEDEEGQRLDALRRFEDLYRENYPAVLRLCRRQLGCQEDAEDVAQEVFSKLARDPDYADDPRAMLFAAARNLCLDHLRRRAAAKKIMDDHLSMPDHPRSVEEDALTRISLANMIARLSPGERKVLLRKVLLDQTHVQAGAELGISSGTAKQLLLRARKRLVRHIAENSLVGALTALPSLARLKGRESWGRFSNRLSALVELPSSLGPVLPVALMVAITAGPVPAQLAVAASQPAPEAQSAGALAFDASHCLGGPCGPGSLGMTAMAGSEASLSAACVVWCAPGGPPRSNFLPAVPLSPNAQAEDFEPQDVQASPNYSSDHRVLAIGANTACAAPPCQVLFESSNAGHSWAQLPALGLVGNQLLLDPLGFAAGRFYSFGDAGLQVTTDGGKTFVPVAGATRGYAAVAPAWTGFDVFVSNVAISAITPQGTPVRYRTLPAGYQAAGAAVVSGSPAATRVVQPAFSVTNPYQSDAVLNCETMCAAIGQLPWSGPIGVIPASPGTGSAVVYLAAGSGAALSADGGQTFHVLAAPAGMVPRDVASAGGSRLVGAFSPPAKPSSVLSYSDNDGSTWQASTLNQQPGLLIDRIAFLGGTSLIATVYSANDSERHTFICSAVSGGSWSAC